MNHADRARELFSCGCNCAQAVVGAYAEEIGLTQEQAMRLASSFGGGMGGMRETCGAVTGMFMVLGLAHGYDAPGDDAAKKAHYARVRALGEAFREKEGTILCRARRNTTACARVCASLRRRRACWSRSWAAAHSVMPANETYSH